jgi:hypothetical protein
VLKAATGAGEKPKSQKQRTDAQDSFRIAAMGVDDLLAPAQAGVETCLGGKSLRFGEGV